MGKSTGTKPSQRLRAYVNKPGVYEIDDHFGREFIYSDEYCGGVRKENSEQHLHTGGSSVPILPANY